MLGFEIVMAPTVIANLKLNYLWKKTGYECASHSSNLFLTNTLNIEIDGNETRGNGTIPPESGLINKLNLSRPLWVIIGNPPYARASRNKSPYIERLLDAYKTAVRTEKNIQPLSDDYIKFIRWAQELIAQTGRGIIGIVTNHTYLTGIIHKGMRQELMRVFDAIYILDLHGSKIIHEDIPFELKDENVFDIKQGICIALFVKNPHRTHKTVYHLDLFGTRAEKFEWLKKNDMSTISWINISNIAPGAPFANPSQIPPEKYNEFHSLSELFEFYNVGGKPGDDKLLVALTPEEVENKLRSFIQKKSTGKVTEAKQKLLGHINDFSFNRANIEKYNYRPFDTRWIYYDPHIWTRPVPKLKEQCNDNLLLLCSRIVKDAHFAHAFISQLFTDVIFLSNTSSVNCYVFPLWKIDNGNKGWNLSPVYVQYLRSMGINIDNLKSTAPMAYLYAILFSTQYRTRYFEFLKRDFPRIPFITDQTLFDKLVQLGETLIQIHLPSDHFEPSSTIQSNISNDDTLKRGFPIYRDEYIFIAPEKWFCQIEKELWDFRIGKFQVCHKWLKDREGRKLTREEILHYHNILLVLKKTIHVMKMIDSLLAEI
jgi:predicted helicase